LPELVHLQDGLGRVTFPLPLGIDHVHCYLLRDDDGGWTLVDTGLGLPGARDRWAAVLHGLDGPLARVVITHFHPDHVGAAVDVAELTGAPVFQGRVDREQSRNVWGDAGSIERADAHMRRHGMPERDLDDLRAASTALAAWVHAPVDPEPLEPGDVVGGWEVLHLPGHADGHLTLRRGDVLIAGDAILADITPNVGFWPECRPDPLADYLASLERLIDLAPRVAFAGHGPPITDPTARARFIVRHHRERLAEAERALVGGPRSGYEVSLALFPEALSAPLRRFALAESLAHLERLVYEGRAERVAAAGRPAYVSA
jgi:glyoxylase-like metal-dependent hydrolase (beta-lactamase superfamily II)